MASNCLRPGERLDDLLISNLKIIQHEAEFCFSLDAVLLAFFATVRAGARAVVQSLPPDAWAPAHADLTRLLDTPWNAL